MSTIWTEKYRPKTLQEVKGQTEIVKRIKAFLEQNNLPHMLFSGPAGIGKTTIALCIARQLYKDDWQHNFLELNASDSRGIDIVRNEIKDFARTKAIANVPFKIIFLDECDSLTSEAQQALRRTMETYTNTTRFILSCNYSTKLIDPIKSRCSIFRFKPLNKEEIVNIVETTMKEENLEMNNDTKELLYELCKGDVRKLYNILQSCASIHKEINKEVLYEIISVAQPQDIQDILSLALEKKFMDARKKLLDTMLNQGLSGLDVIKQVQREVPYLKIEDNKKLQMIEICGEIEFRLVEGSDEYVQLEAMLANFARL